MKYKTFERRMFLTGAGCALSIPVLSSLLSRRVEAQLQTRPLRFVLVTSEYSPNEQCYYGQLKAQQTATGNTLMQSVPYQELVSVQGDISYILSPFTNLKSKISVLKHLDIAGQEGAAHPDSFPSCATGYDGSNEYNNLGIRSVDCLIASSDKVYTSPIAASRRHVACAPMYSGSMKASYDANPAYVAGMPEAQRTSAVQAVSDTDVLWQRFVSLFAPTTDTPDPTNASRTDVLNRVFADYKKVATDARLSSSDRAKLEAYLALIADIQRDLATGASGHGCSTPQREPEMTPPEPPTIGGKMTGEGDNSFLARSMDSLNKTNEWRASSRAIEDVRIRNHMRIVAAAMACDLTRVASFGFGFDGQFDLSHSYDHDGGTWSHQPEQTSYAAAFNQQHRRFAGHVANLAEIFDGIQEDGQSMLDNSIIYWSTQYGTIFRAGDGHSRTSLPALVAGGGGGKLNTGYFIDYSRGNVGADPVGLPLNNLLVSFMNCFGLGSSDYESRAGEGYGGYNGPFGNALPSELKSADARRLPLPFLFKGSSPG